MLKLVQFVDETGKLVGVGALEPKEFKTGSKGYYCSTKLTTPDGKRYQVSCNLVEIGSKPKDSQGQK